MKKITAISLLVILFVTSGLCCCFTKEAHAEVSQGVDTDMPGNHCAGDKSGGSFPDEAHECKNKSAILEEKPGIDINENIAPQVNAGTSPYITHTISQAPEGRPFECFIRHFKPDIPLYIQNSNLLF